MDERVGGLSCVRDGIDIIPLICGHYLRLGLSRLMFFDDKSVDGTYEFLQALSRRDPRVSVEPIDIQDIPHGVAIKNAAANQLVYEGIHLVLPFDQDEFWNLDVRSLRAVSRVTPEGVLHGRFVQFIQDARVTRFSPLGIGKVRYRAPALARDTFRAVEGGKPHLCFSKSKVAFKSAGPVALSGGNHRMDAGPAAAMASDLEVFHLPMRSRSEIEKRGRYTRFPAFHIADKKTEEARAALWRASSADADGCLNSETGEKIMLIPDTRLRVTLWKALSYMVVRHPVLLARAAWTTPHPRAVQPSGELQREAPAGDLVR